MKNIWDVLEKVVHHHPNLTEQEKVDAKKVINDDRTTVDNQDTVEKVSNGKANEKS